jgi:hypothetical protein
MARSKNSNASRVTRNQNNDHAARRSTPGILSRKLKLMTETKLKTETPQPCRNSPTTALQPIGYSCTNRAEHDVAPEQPNAERGTLGKNPSMKKPGKFALLSLLAVMSIIGIVVMVSVADPQSHKFVYLAHINIFGEHPAVPSGFTGVWREWYPDGRIGSTEVVDGKLHGACTMWSSSGRMTREGRFEHGKPVGVHFTYEDYGKIDNPPVHSQKDYGNE